MTETTPDEQPIDPVPLCGNWRNAYATVIGIFAVEVMLFYALTRCFA